MTSIANGSGVRLVMIALPAALCGTAAAIAARALSRGSTIAAAPPADRNVNCWSAVTYVTAPSMNRVKCACTRRISCDVRFSGGNSVRLPSRISVRSTFPAKPDSRCDVPNVSMRRK